MGDFLDSVGGASLIGGALNLAGTGIQQAFAHKNMKRQHEYNKATMQYSWDNQIPSVVNSLERAGLNKALMYSNGGPSVSGSTGSTTAPQISNPLLGVGELMLDQQFKKEQIEAMKIENLYREERLRNENALGALKLKTEEATEQLLQAEFRNKEQQTAIGKYTEQLEQYLADFQRDANPYLISKAHAEWNNIMEEAQKLKDESEQVRITTARLASRLLRQEYESVARTFYYNSLGSAASKDSNTRQSSQQFKEQMQPRIVAVQEAAQAYREDMKSWEKYEIFMKSLSDAFSAVAASASTFGMVGKGSQPAGKMQYNRPYGTDMDFDFPDF